MLDIKLIREQPDAVEENLKKRNDPEKIKLLKDLVQKDRLKREKIQEA